VALILAIVALNLARLGRDRLADLADELGRALVETDDRVLRIGRFGIGASFSAASRLPNTKRCLVR
jgi:hypothetical protein